MKLTRLVGECDENECPTLYRTERGTLAVQGDAVTGHGLDVPDGEGIVEIPVSLIQKAIANGLI